MIHPTDEARWRELESKAHLPEVQEIIREEILRGTIRVRPKRGGGIRIVPVGIPEREEPIDVEPRPPHRRARQACPEEWLSGVASHVANTSSMPTGLQQKKLEVT